MKKYQIYHFICSGIAVLSILFPFRHFQGINSHLQSTPSLDFGLTFINPFDPFYCIAPIALIVITSVMLLVKNNLVTSIISIINAFLLLVSLVFLGLNLQVIFMGFVGGTYGTGFYLLLITSFVYIGLLIRNLILVTRVRKGDSKIIDVSSE